MGFHTLTKTVELAISGEFMYIEGTDPESKGIYFYILRIMLCALVR
jgi:hypothetical protein